MTRAQLFLALRAAVLVGLLAFLWGRLDFTAIAESYQGVAAPTVGAVLASFALAMAVRVGKWWRQARALGFVASPLVLARDFLMGILLGAVTPARAGEVYRLRGMEHPGSTRADTWALGAGAVVLEKGYELFVLVAIVALGAAFDLPILALALSPVLLIGGYFALGNPHITLPGPLRRIAAPLYAARDRLPPKERVFLLTATLLAHTLNLAGALGVYRAFGTMPASTLFFRMPLVTLSNVLPLSIGGIGVRETTAMYVFGMSGFPPSSAAIAASLVFVGTTLVPCLFILPLEGILHSRR